MIKKILVMLVTVSLLAFLGACTSSPKVTATTSAAETTPAETTFLTGPFGDKDLVFSHQGVSIVLLSDVQALLSALGEDYTLEAAVSCMFVGEDKRFIYNGFEIFTYPIDGQDQIDEILITDTTFATPRGISVGDSYDSVVAVYGEGTFDEVVLTYILPGGDPESNPRLIFGIEDGTVHYISFYSARNMR